MGKTVVVALGGNAILQSGQRGTVEEQRENVRKTSASIVSILEAGYRVVVTHGNGPQVGNVLIQQEEAKNLVPPMTLDICGAQTQGQIGYLLQQTLKNELLKRGYDKPVVTLLTQVVVDARDPAFQNPTKPVGPFYTREKAEKLMQEKGYIMKEDSGRGWRRVVPSPDPLAILEADIIRDLVERGVLVIASGGGGVPVMRLPDGSYQGLEAVIDKDLAGEKLAREVNADLLLILTDVEKVALNFRQPNQVLLDRVTLAEGRRYQKEGHFKAGSMGPKMEAALRFVESGREMAIITALDKAVEALAGKTGTRVVREG